MKSKVKKVTINGEKYTLLRKLGEGNRGAVYLAEDSKKNLICVKKESSQKRAEQEIKAINGYYSPFQTNLFEKKDSYYFAMPYFPGKTLKDVMKAGLTLFEKLTIAQKLKEQLDNLHLKGILHRDIKTDNIMVNIEKGKIEVNIIDLGRSVPLDAGEEDLELKTKKVSLAFQQQVAPEYLYGTGKDIGQHSDVYSYGKIFKSLFPESKHTIQKLIGKEGSTRSEEFNNLNAKLEGIFDKKRAVMIQACDKLLKYFELPESEKNKAKYNAVTVLKDNLKNIPDFTSRSHLTSINESFDRVRECFKQDSMPRIVKLLYDFLAIFGVRSERAIYREIKHDIKQISPTQCIDKFHKSKEKLQMIRTQNDPNVLNNVNVKIAI